MTSLQYIFFQNNLLTGALKCKIITKCLDYDIEAARDCKCVWFWRHAL